MCWRWRADLDGKTLATAGERGDVLVPARWPARFGLLAWLGRLQAGDVGGGVAVVRECVAAAHRRLGRAERLVHAGARVGEEAVAAAADAVAGVGCELVVVDRVVVGSVDEQEAALQGGVVPGEPSLPVQRAADRAARLS